MSIWAGNRQPGWPPEVKLCLYQLLDGPDLTGAAALHTQEAYVIDAAGRVRQKFSTSPGPGTAAIRSSFAVLFANTARQVLTSPDR